MKLRLLAAAALIASASIATAHEHPCSDQRQGSFFPQSSDRFLLTCWPVQIDASTAITNSQGQAVDFASLQSGDQLTATGCLDIDGFTLLAQHIVLDTPANKGVAADATVVFGFSGTSFYTVNSTTDSLISPIGTSNPTLSLEIGKRYQFQSNAEFAHPFSLIAKGASPANDVPLLIQGSANGSAEGFPDIDWVSTGQDMFFTLTPSLADFMTPTGRTPGYRCNFHTGSMRGNITFRPRQSSFTWTGDGVPQTESFENAQKGIVVSQAFNDWTVVTDDPSNYTPVISDLPAGSPGQVASSTRWLTVTDGHDAASIQDRVYSNSIVVPNSTDMQDYSWDFWINVQTTAAGTQALPIVQHFNTATSQYANVWGIEVTNTGVNLVLIGTDDGGAGQSGATGRTLLYNFSDAGFGKGNWVRISLHAALNADMLMVSAEAPDGTDKVAEFILPSFPMANIDVRNQRFCIRNTGAGNTSTISYDNVSFSGTAASTSVESWLLY